ncbi:MAG: hypothetical protein IJS65_03195 [Clostridia bacterium]|nr:hypothetical protein [Clostridia bacterium]
MKKTKRRVATALIWSLIALIAVSAGTYAWFTFNPYTNVTEMTGVVWGGEGDLLIANKREGPYGVYTELILSEEKPVLYPVSTSNLNNFFTQGKQTSGGVVTGFSLANDGLYKKCVHGFVYLKSETNAHDIYFDKSGLYFGKDIQSLAAMRLGLQISTPRGIYTHIFKLDDMADVSSALSRLTVAQKDTVVAQANDNGSVTFSPDPAKNINDYCAGRSGEDTTRGRAALCRLGAGEIATVEYFLYLEGCDENCYNPVQNRDLALSLAFSGVN